MKKSSKVLPILAGIAAFAVSSYFVKQYFISSDQQRIHDAIVEGFQLTVRQLSPDLPKRVDDLTTLQSVSAEDVRFYYYYVLDDIGFSKAEWEEGFVEIRAMVSESVCGAVDMVQTMEYGGSFIYDYQSHDGKKIGVIEFEKGACP